MKIIRPVAITDAVLTSSTVTEADNPAWASGTTYALDALVIRSHHRWQSLQASNTNHAPETSPEWWLDLGMTNRWAMFDDKVGSVTADTGLITVVLTPGGIDALALLDVEAENATVTMESGGDEVYSRIGSTNVGGQAITDWYLYFFEPIGKRRTILFDDLPIYADGVVTIEIAAAAPTDPVSVGTLIVGLQMEIGSTEASPKIGIDDFSRKETDDFGVTSIVQRAWRKRMSARVLMPASSVDQVQQTLADYRAKPLVWIGSELFDAMLIYGFYKSFEIDIAFSHLAYCSLEIEGLSTDN